jgi:hypothetical protein
MPLDVTKLRAALENKVLEDKGNPEAAAAIRDAIDKLADDLLADVSALDGIEEIEPQVIVDFVYKTVVEQLTQG